MKVSFLDHHFSEEKCLKRLLTIERGEEELLSNHLPSEHFSFSVIGQLHQQKRLDASSLMMTMMRLFLLVMGVLILQSCSHNMNVLHQIASALRAVYMQRLIKQTNNSSTNTARVLKYNHYYKQITTNNNETQSSYLIPRWCVSLR